MIRQLLPLLPLPLLISLLACGDDTAATGGGATGGAAAQGGAGAATTGGNGTGAGDPGPTELVGDLSINEIQAYGLEWVELVNTSGAAIDLEGYSLCDEDAIGGCDLGKRVVFPKKTIAAGGYVVVIADQALSGQEVVSGCPMPVGECITAQWKISAADGETIRLLDDADNVVAAFTYPPAATADDTRSWARSPDGTGAGKAAVPSPGATNP